MSFLQPMFLVAMPLVALPIIIHLINQRRYQTVRWGAMMFLLAANRMSRGFARIRQWLIMAFRMLAIAGLIVAISRPLAGGWLGMAAGTKPDTTVVLLDRSPSMQQSEEGGGGSKLETGRRQIVRTLPTLGSGHWLLVEGATNTPRELEAPEALASTPGAEPVSASSDIPAMLLAARDYIRANKTGRTEVWICSDLRANDWDPEGGRWSSLREAFLEMSQSVRFHVLAYPRPAPGNLAVRVTGVRRQPTANGAELLLSLSIRREGAKEGEPPGEGESRRSIPIQVEIDGARSELTVEMTGPTFELKDHKLPIERTHVKGWGRVSIPADANPADDDDWFVFDEPAPRHAVIVAEDAQAGRPLQLAASIPPAPTVKASAEVVAPDKVAGIEWEKVSVLLWQAPLPDPAAAKSIEAYLGRGGQVLFFPPRNPGKEEFRGVRWTAWEQPAKALTVTSWRGDQDILSQTLSGGPLPVGQLQVDRHCGLEGEVTALGTLDGGAPLLARLSTDSGGAYFCGTTPAPTDSSMAANGVVLYVMIQRLSEAGAKVLGSTRELIAGPAPAGEQPATWKRIAGADQGLSTDASLHRGIYQAGERMIAVTRAPAEDLAPVVADERLAGLFRGLDYSRVDDRAGNIGSLIQETWRIFLVAMMVAMVVEAALCMPRPRPAASGGTPGGAAA
ncbi:BatA domain-containing protein [Aquisphaera insulae]|uniref:BatA domain-containing protein n=1 Tax=Aquisphaera insulae TaxID=2712864 RepID=UPI0013EDB7C3|nr:BatA domain-containing protein [Aquisphaera insulae]